MSLAASLQDRLRGAGFALERRPFHPHLTLARHCTHLPATTAPTFDWPVNQFTLFASENTASGAHTAPRALATAASGLKRAFHSVTGNAREHSVNGCKQR